MHIYTYVCMLLAATELEVFTTPSLSRLYTASLYFSDQLVFVQGAAATPTELLRAMTEYGVRCDVRNVRLFHMHLEGEASFAKPENASK